jgi:ribonucleoside-diphosphate reductase beta chain
MTKPFYVNRTQLFNPEGNDRSNRIWCANHTGMMQLNLKTILNQQCYPYYSSMFDQHWSPEKVNLAEDQIALKALDKPYRKVYDSFLAYLTFLDSVQVSNIPQVAMPVTCAGVKSFLSKQIEQETLHSRSYQHMILTLYPENEQNKVYELVQTDKVLQARCKYIADIYQQYLDNQTAENYYQMLVANYLLEGLYFYSGFMYFYNLQELSGTVAMIKYINKDELWHIKGYATLLKKIVPEFKENKIADLSLLKDKVYQMFDEAMKHELEWSNYILDNKILGMDSVGHEHYLKWLTNSRLNQIGLEPLYSKSYTNTYAHLYKLADINPENDTIVTNVKQNFFETTVTSYNTNYQDYDF